MRRRTRTRWGNGKNGNGNGGRSERTETTENSFNAVCLVLSLGGNARTEEGSCTTGQFDD